MPKKRTQTFRKDDLLDDKVERALYKMATGYYAVVKRPMWNPKLRKHVVVTFKEYYPPDPAAARFWLVCRRPNRWPVKPQPDPAEDIFKRAFTIGIFERNLDPKQNLAEMGRRAITEPGTNSDKTMDQLSH